MKIMLERSNVVVPLPAGAGPARLWKGVTESGVEINVLICLIAVRDDLRALELEYELMEIPRTLVDPTLANAMILAGPR